jgi:hypothetical protein
MLRNLWPDRSRRGPVGPGGGPDLKPGPIAPGAGSESVQARPGGSAIEAARSLAQTSPVRPVCGPIRVGSAPPGNSELGKTERPAGGPLPAAASPWPQAASPRNLRPYD